MIGINFLLYPVLADIERKGGPSRETIEGFFLGDEEKVRECIEYCQDMGLIEEVESGGAPQYRVLPEGEDFMEEAYEEQKEECRGCENLRHCVVKTLNEEGFNATPVVVDLIVASDDPLRAFTNALDNHLEVSGASVITLETAGEPTMGP